MAESVEAKKTGEGIVLVLQEGLEIKTGGMFAHQVETTTGGRLPKNAKFEAQEFTDKEEAANGLILALHKSFQLHWSLRLRPDDIWLTVMQALAIAIRNDPERCRPLLVNHEGKDKIELRNDGLLSGGVEAWKKSIHDLAAEVRKRTETKLSATLTKTFTTTDDLAATAQCVALLDAAAPFFDYSLRSLCGIPKITLLGTVDDWIQPANAMKSLPLAELGLDFWRKSLDFVADGLLATAQNPSKVDLKFWQSIYKYASFSGGHAITGWIIKLFPFLIDGNGGIKQNPFLAREPKDDPDGFRSEGLSSSSIPIGLSSVPFKWFIGPGSETEHKMRLLAGFGDVEMNAEQHEITPRFGWCVFHDGSIEQRSAQKLTAHDLGEPKTGCSCVVL